MKTCQGTSHDCHLIPVHFGEEEDGIRCLNCSFIMKQSELPAPLFDALKKEIEPS